MALFASILVLFLSVFFAIASMSQCRKPSYWMGRRVARSMNLRHRKLTRWGFSFVSFDSSSSILDVGCGGGQTVREIGSSMPNMRVVGLDYARGSISVASVVNEDLIKAGHALIIGGNVIRLPFRNASFDAVTAIETHYYWPELGESLKEIRRVLKENGFVVLIAEVYQKESGKAEALVMGMLGGQIFTAVQHREALESAGFINVQIHEEQGRGWICAVGQCG